MLFYQCFLWTILWGKFCCYLKVSQLFSAHRHNLVCTHGVSQNFYLCRKNVWNLKNQRAHGTNTFISTHFCSFQIQRFDCNLLFWDTLLTPPLYFQNQAPDWFKANIQGPARGPYGRTPGCNGFMCYCNNYDFCNDSASYGLSPVLLVSAFFIFQ